MPDANPPVPPLPEARTVGRKKTRLSAVWVIPIVAAVAGAWVTVARILGEGPKITIIFRSAEGLEAGKTKIKYSGVVIGTVTQIRLADDHEHVIATAQMEPSSEAFLVEDTKFWVVRPRISGANVTGLSTLISGAYVGVDIGKSKKSERRFTALTDEPVVTGDVPGRFFRLKTPTLGSLDTGTPIYFRHLQVGQVASYALDPDGNALTVKIFVKAPYDQYVSPNTRFWHASGIDVSLGAQGITVQTQSVLSILVGGIAFETPVAGPVLPPAAPDAEFTLFRDRAEAFKLPEHEPQTYAVVFDESVRGLAPGAPVEFRGITVGEVTSVEAHVDPETFTFTVPVMIHLDPQRLGVVVADLPAGADRAAQRRELIDRLISRGVRAQIRSGNLLTGARYIAFDFFPDAPPAKLDWSQKPVRLPTIPGEVEQLEARLASILKKVDQLPFQAIGKDLRKALDELDRTLVSARATLDDAGKMVEPSSALSAELTGTLSEVSRAARALRALADLLEQHPESLIRGKEGEAK